MRTELQHGNPFDVAQDRVVHLGERIERECAVFQQGGGFVVQLWQAGEAYVADRYIAVVLAETDEVEAEVGCDTGGYACEVNAVGAAAICIVDAGDAIGQVLGAVGLQVEEGIGAGEACATQERSTGVGIQQGDFEGVVRCAGQVIQGGAGKRKAQEAVGRVEQEDLAQAGLAAEDFVHHC